MGSSEVMVGLKGLWSTVVEVAGFALYPVEVGPKAMVESVGFVLAFLKDFKCFSIFINSKNYKFLIPLNFEFSRISNCSCNLIIK